MYVDRSTVVCTAYVVRSTLWHSRLPRDRSTVYYLHFSPTTTMKRMGSESDGRVVAARGASPEPLGDVLAMIEHGPFA
jgi:hypothetical protein